MQDNMDSIWNKFQSTRDQSIWAKFSGRLRAIVVETNDPLNMHRVRFKCPDMHDSTLRAEECPWATPEPSMASGQSGSWYHPCIGDWIWISFERNHPYGPVWSGMAPLMRRRNYPLPAIYQPTPVSVNNIGIVQGRPDDYLQDYLPADGRPMSNGHQDRYGNLDIQSSIGFYPSEHARRPPAPDFDSLSDAAFIQAQAVPLVNAPDGKFMARVSKYGSMQIICDQGYWWQKVGERGEFVGDQQTDSQFEVTRWKYIRRLINENKPSGNDQRGFLHLTRYGNKFEMRDTGWAQPGPIQSKSRQGEYGDPTYLSNEVTNDFRWIKLRTKGGWVQQASDKGFDPQNDEYVSRLLIDETGPMTEREDVHWANKDARWWRVVGRHGFKIVIDERGTHPSRAQALENPRGNGILIKGRRTPGCKTEGAVSGDPRGHYWEFNENDNANHTTWGTAAGQAIEMNDATEYMALAVGLGRDYARPWRGIEENEFLLEPTRARNPEGRAYHLIMDHQNEYLRLKTRGGRGIPAGDLVNPSGLNAGDLNQGLEAHDGSRGDGPWVELVDSQGRGLWFSRNNNLSVLRAKSGSKIYVWLDDVNNRLVIHNDQVGGVTQIYSRGNIDVIGGTTVNVAAQNINFKAGEKIRFEAGNTPLTLSNGRLDTRADIFGSRAHVRIAGTLSVDDVSRIARAEATAIAGQVAVGLRAAVQRALDSAVVSGPVVRNAVQNGVVRSNVAYDPPAVPAVGRVGVNGAGDPMPGGDAVAAIQAVDVPAQLEPLDRATTYNIPSVIDKDDVEHPI